MTVRLSDVVDRHQVRVIQTGGYLRFTLKAPAGAGIGHVRRKEFHGNLSVQLRIESAIDDTHTALSDFGLDPVLR
jgi:hypothetical protein